MLLTNACRLGLALAAVLVGGSGAGGCATFRPERSAGTFQPYKEPGPEPPPPRPPTVIPERLSYLAGAGQVTRCAAPLEVSVRRIEGERRGSEVTVVLEAVLTNPHRVPVTVERQLRLRAGAGVELPFWQQFDARRGRAVASSGGGVVLLPLDMRENDGFTGPEQRTLPAGSKARTPTVTYKGLLGRGEESLLELQAGSTAPKGGGCQYRVQLHRR